MPHPSPRFDQPSPTDRLFNRFFGLLIRLGLALPHNFLLEIPGRRTGRLYATPVDVLTHDRRRFLVAARGETQWARNARGGRASLRKGARREECALRPVADADKPPLLKAYLDRYRLTVQRFFPVSAGAPLEEFVPLAPRYPVFEIVPSRDREPRRSAASARASRIARGACHARRRPTVTAVPATDEFCTAPRNILARQQLDAWHGS